MRRRYLVTFLAGSAAIPATFVACSGGGTSPATAADAATPTPDATRGDATGAGPAMAADGASDAPDVVADTSTPDSSPSEIDTGLDAGPPPGDALASLSMCPPLAEPVAELDAAGCGTLKVL